jgi:HlyD family secretion protein
MSASGTNTIWFRVQDAFARIQKTLDGWVEARFREDRAGADRAMAHQFKGDATAIEEAPVPVSAHAALYVVVTLLVLGVFWSIFGTLDRIVVAQGKVASRTPMIVMQPFTTSRITQIRVKPGDHVRKGQVLVSFDPAFARADQAALEQKVRDKTAEIDRLTAELAGAKSFSVSKSDGSERQTQAQIFTQEMAQYSSEMAQRDSRAGAVDSQLKAVNASLPGLKSQLAIAQKVMSIQNYLNSQQAAAELDVLRAQNAQIDAETKLNDASADSQRYSQQRAEIDAERNSFRDKWRSDHNQQLVQARLDLAEASQTLSKARRMSDFTELAAPEDATVLEIADRSVGSVMKEAETLLTLVPDKAELYVEANVPSRDVSYVKVGDGVRVKLETYPFQRFGTLDGTLDVISADSIPLKEGDQSQLVYRAQVRVATPVKDMIARGIHLRPGLVATAEIKTGKRSIASYILDPVLRTMDEGLREP